MKVKELIELLKKCHPESEVEIEDRGDDGCDDYYTWYEINCLDRGFEGPYEIPEEALVLIQRGESTANG